MDSDAARDATQLDGGALDAQAPGASLDGGAAAELCDPVTGLGAPLRACTPSDPCVRLASDIMLPRLTDPTPVPRCDHPALALMSIDAAGFRRHACVARPSGASPEDPRPLVLFFHPGGADGADTLALSTQLVTRHQNHDWGAGPRGFFVAAIHGRNLHYPTLADRDGRHHDFLYRDLGYPSRNPDVAAIDTLVARLVAEGADPNRVFVMGWSNGGFFGQMLAIARHGITGAGYRVAAASAFATADPFAAVERDPRTDEELPTPLCALSEVPASDLPIQLVYRSCDLAVPCGASQLACFGGEPGYDTTAWLTRAAGRLAITPLLIGGYDRGSTGFNHDAIACHGFGATCPPPRTLKCTTSSRDIDCLCYFNHLIWPDGVTDASDVTVGPDREADMLTFLANHPLP
jgi:predicted esterase